MLLKDRVAVVSGAGPGLGRAMALALAREGANVVLVARSEGNLLPIAAQIEAAGRPVLCVQADITDESACARALERTLATFGRVDVLVNNAFATGPMEAISDANIMKSWRAPFKVNLFGTLQLSQTFAVSMKQNKKGSIIMINSMAARKPTRDLAAYGASKAALLYAAKALAVELGPHGIRVNSLVPGHIDGPSLNVYVQMEAQRLSITEEAARQSVAAEGVMNRIATSEEVANAAIFLASDLSVAVTGQALDVNCGQWFD